LPISIILFTRSDKAFVPHQENQPIAVNKGRNFKISHPTCETLGVNRRKKALKEDCYTKPAFQEDVKKEFEMEAKKDPNLPEGVVQECSERTIRRTMNMLFPVKVRAFFQQNERRSEALNDAYNAISLDAIWPAVVGIGNDHTVDQEFSFSINTTCASIGDDDVAFAYLSEGC